MREGYPKPGIAEVIVLTPEHMLRSHRARATAAHKEISMYVGVVGVEARIYSVSGC